MVFLITGKGILKQDVKNMNRTVTARVRNLLVLGGRSADLSSEFIKSVKNHLIMI